MKQKNLDLQLKILKSQDDVGGAGESETGLYNMLSKDRQVTFDYQGNLIIVKGPKIQRRLRAEVKYQL